MAEPKGKEASEEGRPGVINRLVWWLNVLAVGVFLLTYLAPHISPRSAWMLALLAMSYPYQLLLQFGFILWWTFFLRRRMLVSLVVVLIGWSHVGDHFQLFGRSAPAREVQGEGVKLLSWNVRLFDLYNWTSDRSTRDSIFSVLRREDADILCLQEFFHSPEEKRFFRSKSELMQDMRYRYVHDSYSHVGRFGSHFGIATFSTYPIVDRGVIVFEEHPHNQCIWSDIAIGKDTIRVYNAHLASYHFGDDEHQFLKDLEEGTDTENIKRGGLRILKLLRKGLRSRADEVEQIAAHMAESRYHVVYCGDMNDVPMSYSYATLRKGRRDAFRESGRGTGNTYIGRLPSLRIDHILHDPELESWGHRTLPEEYSDHHAITCIIAPLAKKASTAISDAE